MTKHTAMYNFFKDIAYQVAADTVNFNFSAESPDAIAFITDYSEKYLKHYIRGGKKKYGFSIIVTKNYSVDDDDINLQAINFAQSMMDWVDEQNRKKNFPVLPGNCRVISMENLQNMPNLAGVNTDLQLARYMMQMELIYEEF